MGICGKTCLLNPGPVNLSTRVRQALLSQDLCHRESEFSMLQQDVRERLTRVYPAAAAEYTTVLFTGSGTAAVEAMVGSLVPRYGKALVAANGVYGERIAAMLKAHGKSYEVVSSQWTDPIRLQAVSEKLANDTTITHVIAVHHETTTGRLNPIARLGDICSHHGVGLLLDAVSSFGGEAIDFHNGAIEACAATANKCLHGAPGISFVMVKKSALQKGQSGACSVYLDLFSNHAAQAGGAPLFTPAVQSLYALQEALKELEESGGWTARHKRYRRLSEIVRNGFEEIGIEYLLPSEAPVSAMLTAFNIPEGFAFEALHKPLKKRGFIIYPGQSFLQLRIFRVAVMGDLADQELHRFVRVIGTLLTGSIKNDESECQEGVQQPAV